MKVKVNYFAVMTTVESIATVSTIILAGKKNVIQSKWNRDVHKFFHSKTARYL